jgi:hypothetical protein
MMIYDVFGRLLGVQKAQDGWHIFRANLDEGKYARLYEINIPSFVTEIEIAGWLDDIYHESASPKHPHVIRVN